MSGYVALEVDPDTLRPVTGPILGWGRDKEDALSDYHENAGMVGGVQLMGIFPWNGPEDPDGQDVWEYDRETGIVRLE